MDLEKVDLKVELESVRRGWRAEKERSDKLKDDKDLLTGQLQQARKHASDADLQLRGFAQAVADKQTECKMEGACDIREPGLPYCLPCWSREIVAGKVADSRVGADGRVEIPASAAPSGGIGIARSISYDEVLTHFKECRMKAFEGCCAEEFLDNEDTP